MTGDHPTLEETAALAAVLHAGQSDKAGKPYVGHLARVAGHLQRLFPQATLAERHAAWLHDAIEDTPTTASDLAAHGYDPVVVQIVSAVTRQQDGRSYQQWIEDIAASGFLPAMRVKLADLTDNSDPARLEQLPPERAASLAKRYDRAKRALLAAIEAQQSPDETGGE